MVSAFARSASSSASLSSPSTTPLPVSSPALACVVTERRSWTSDCCARLEGTHFQRESTHHSNNSRLVTQKEVCCCIHIKNMWEFVSSMRMCMCMCIECVRVFRHELLHLREWDCKFMWIVLPFSLGRLVFTPLGAASDMFGCVTLGHIRAREYADDISYRMPKVLLAKLEGLRHHNFTIGSRMLGRKANNLFLHKYYL